MFSLQINPIMNVIMMIPTKTFAPKIFRNIISEDYEGGATITANFCCQIITEQFDKVQLTQKHVIMLVKTVGYIHCSLVNGFKVGQNVSVSGFWGFIEFSRGVSIIISCSGKFRRRGSTGAFMRLCSVSVVTSSQNSANVSLALMLSNVLMVMTASEKTFSCRKRLSLQTNTHTQAATMLEQIATQHQSQKNSNCCMCTCTPRI